jgi:arylsulfatase A-like enzyme
MLFGKVHRKSFKELEMRILMIVGLSLFLLTLACELHAARPNVVLVMADDQGWGETSYNGHPLLKTPNLDAMAAAGLRFDRFYAGGPVCSPTRASVLTGRSHNRTGVQSHGYALRLQEKTLAQAFRSAGYRTGHFGKWHLNGLRGPGVPVLAADTHHPGVFGFDEWLSVTNFFDRNPLLSRGGMIEDYQGDSSEVVVEQALQFLAGQALLDSPSLTVIWFGSPHSPFVAVAEDRAAFANLDLESQNHYGELVAMDRSIGRLRQGLREIGIAENTLVWFMSDNGGLPKVEPTTVANLRGFKGSLYEGGIRVPAIIEWPSGIQKPRVTNFPASAVDIFSTLAEILDLPDAALPLPQDGISLVNLFEQSEDTPRSKPIPFNYSGETALIDNQYKLLQVGKGKNKPQSLEIYDLSTDPGETTNLAEERPEVTRRLKLAMEQWQAELAASIAGRDYPEGRVIPGEPEPQHWSDVEGYAPYFEDWKRRPEYRGVLK